MFLLMPLRKTKTRISETDCCLHTARRKRIFTIHRSGEKNANPPELNSINYSQQIFIKLFLDADPTQTLSLLYKKKKLSPPFLFRCKLYLNTLNVWGAEGSLPRSPYIFSASHQFPYVLQLLHQTAGFLGVGSRASGFTPIPFKYT